MRAILNQRVSCVQGGFKLRFYRQENQRQTSGRVTASFEVMCSGFVLFSKAAVVICTARRHTSKGRRRQGVESVPWSWRYGRGSKTHMCVEQSFYSNKVLLDISAEYGREVKDLFSLLVGGRIWVEVR